MQENFESFTVKEVVVDLSKRFDKFAENQEKRDISQDNKISSLQSRVDKQSGWAAAFGAVAGFLATLGITWLKP